MVWKDIQVGWTIGWTDEGLARTESSGYFLMIIIE